MEGRKVFNQILKIFLKTVVNHNTIDQLTDCG